MNATVHRTDDPALETTEFGAVYRIHAPRTGEPWTLCKVTDDCGVNSIGPLEVPDGWDDSYEYAKGDMRIWSYITHLARDADLAHTNLEVAVVHLDDEEMATKSCALLHRFTWPY